MPADKPPFVDVAEVVRLVGRLAYERAAEYVRRDAVVRWNWDAANGAMTAFVAGSEPRPYSVRLSLVSASKGRHRLRAAHCSCPVDGPCKHVAAVVLTSNTAHLKHEESLKLAETAKRRAAEAELPAWKRAIEALTDRGAASADTTGQTRTLAPMGVQFELREHIASAAYRWNSPSTAPLTPDSSPANDVRLCVRPVMRNSRGNWVKADLSWNRLSHNRSLDLDPEHRRWMVQFAALSRNTRDVYYGQDTEWLELDDFSSQLLWGMLNDAVRMGIGLVGTKKSVAVRIGETAEISLDARLDGDLSLTPTLRIDGEEHNPASARTIGDHGVYSWAFAPDPVITLAPAAGTLSAEHRRLLGADPDPGPDPATRGGHPNGPQARTRAPGGHTAPAPSGTITVPADQVDEFLTDYFPRLRQILPVTSADASVRFPEIQPPVLVLTATFRPKHVLALDWAWEYPSSDATFPIVGGSGDARANRGRRTGADDAAHDALRDAAAEARLAEAASKVLGAHPERRILNGLEAAEFASTTLNLIERVDGIRVVVQGDRPDYRELDETPTFAVKTVETDERDWFDLGVIVSIEGREIPFGPLFKALSQGRKKLLLIDGSYFSLLHPAFDRLRELLDEASSLAEWEPGSLRISRYQAGLWADFENLADETEAAVSWRATAAGLTELSTIERPPAPSGLRAELRDYQLDGFAWLAFLHDHGLGGILADDMGLGKTLQTLTLIAHARERPRQMTDATATDATSERRPFLVVAPTSVVSNWVAEAARFTPDLAVTSITATTAKRKTSLAELAAGADIVVTSYALFRLDAEEYHRLGWDGLILDEAQFVKNRSSRAHEVATDLSAPFKLAITGTPMENNLLELWSLFAIVAPGLFPSARQFTERYVRPLEGTRPGIRNRGESGKPPQDPAVVLGRLHRRIRPLMMRRTKELVAAELPEKQEQVLTVELAPRHRKIYDMYLQRERQKLLGLIEDLDRNRFIVFRSLTLLRMLSLDASLIEDEYAGVPSSKLDVLFEQLGDVIAEGHRTLVFSQFTSFLRKAAERLESLGVPYAYLDGSTTGRGEVIERFRAGEAPVFLISLKAGGFGLNLTEADYVFLLDPWWNPASEAQAIDRTHRIGQTKNVMVYRLVAEGTIEEKVMALKAKKAKLFSQVMDDESGTFSASLTADDIRGLLEH